MRRVLILALLIPMLACRTVGVAREKGGYAMVRPAIANEMILDNRTIIVFDFRSEAEYDGPLGHVAGALSTPLDAIESRLPLLLPYQAGTVMVYADTADEAIRGAKLLVASGFRNVVMIDGGIREWIDRGYRTVIQP
ncbi:MAG TPA: rhodanese-like domain-containing protein [Thermoanaerobaculia bacterium]|nr:rhodanese-like domain-containing protein [Thermoanaerobaculia bacterium]